MTSAPTPTTKVEDRDKENVQKILAEMERVEGYVPLPPGTLSVPAIPEPDAVESDSKTWAERFFRPLASPWRPYAKRDRAYHLGSDQTPDVLRHAYAVDQLGITVYERPDIIVVSVDTGADDLLGLPADKQRDRVREIADALLNMNGKADEPTGKVHYQWDLQLLLTV